MEKAPLPGMTVKMVWSYFNFSKISRRLEKDGKSTIKKDGIGVSPKTRREDDEDICINFAIINLGKKYTNDHEVRSRYVIL